MLQQKIKDSQRKKGVYTLNVNVRRRTGERKDRGGKGKKGMEMGRVGRSGEGREGEARKGRGRRMTWN